MAKNKSIEEQVDFWCKQQLQGVKLYSKTESINPEIEDALRKAPSKKGGDGINYPDIKCFITTSDMRHIPVVIEVKGTKGNFLKLDTDGSIQNKKSDGTPYYSNISKYAINGAVHYAHAILNYTESYKEVIAIGVNGYDLPTTERVYEIGVYYVSKDNLFIPKKVGEFTDLSFLKPKHIDNFIDRINKLPLSDAEIEKKKLELEDDIERKLKDINQKMHDELKIVVGARVQLITGLVMAGLGVPNHVNPLRVSDLTGELGEESNDGKKVMNKISDYLRAKNLPAEKIQMIKSVLNVVFLHSKLQEPINGESRLHTLYADVKQSIMPFLTVELHNIDFTGRLFNVLNEWVDVPDGDKNDVVLTPRYVTELMARLCFVNKDSYVWDFATGSAGFLISAMHQMIADAKDKIQSPEELNRKIAHIKMEQLMGIEKLPDIYLLAVLNMILMKDGSSNIIHGDSLKEFQGNYEQGKRKGEKFPANVFLLNPPYSAEGKGFVFVKKALEMMNNGYAAVLIQENAGSGKGLPYTRDILKHNTLLASIHMSDIFCGKANVQTTIYLFRVGTPHNTNQVVKFIDFSNDGYSRQNRKKSSQNVNLRDTNNAKERYDELFRIVSYGRGVNDCNLNYFRDSYVEDYISLEGNDWIYSQHKQIDTNPSIEDFTYSIKNYLSWRVKDICKKTEEREVVSSVKIETEFLKNGGEFKTYKAVQLFEIKANPQLNKESFVFSSKSKYPYFTRTVFNNGILGYVDYLDDEHLIKGNSLAVGMMGMKFFYMEHDFYAGQFTKTAFPLFDGFNEKIAQYFIAWFNKSSDKYKSALVRDFEAMFYNTKIRVPINNGKISTAYIEQYIDQLQINCISEKKRLYKEEIEAYFIAANINRKL